MAIKLQKTATLVEPFEFISKKDDALDRDAKDFKDRWDRYKDGLGDPPIKEGMKPTVFTLKPVARDAGLDAKLDGVLNNDGNAMWCLTAAAFGIAGWRNLIDPDTDEELEFETVRAHGYDCITKALQDKLTKPLLIEIGNAVLLHNNPSLD